MPFALNDGAEAKKVKSFAIDGQKVKLAATDGYKIYDSGGGGGGGVIPNPYIRMINGTSGYLESWDNVGDPVNFEFDIRDVNSFEIFTPSPRYSLKAWINNNDGYAYQDGIYMSAYDINSSWDGIRFYLLWGGDSMQSPGIHRQFELYAEIIDNNNDEVIRQTDPVYLNIEVGY